MAHRRFGAFYARSFERRPWLTLAVANASLGALSDILAQGFERVSSKRPQPAAELSTLDSLKEKAQRVESKAEDTVRASVGKQAAGKISIDGHGVAGANTVVVQTWDVARTARFFAFGTLMAPLLAEWNKFIEFRFPLKSAGAAASNVGKVSLKALGKRVAVDQILL